MELLLLALLSLHILKTEAVGKSFPALSNPVLRLLSFLICFWLSGHTLQALWFFSMVNEGWLIYSSAFYYLWWIIKDRLCWWMNECFGGFFSPLEILSAFLLQEKSMSFDLIYVIMYVHLKYQNTISLSLMLLFKLEGNLLFVWIFYPLCFAVCDPRWNSAEGERTICLCCISPAAPSIFAPWAL